MNVQQIPLSKLDHDARNVRKTGGTNISDLAASLLVHGVLQNLIVQPAADGRFGVVAGGRRLKALRYLVDAGKLPADYDVPCQILEGPLVDGEVSLAENVIREAMNPADQFEAFRRLVDSGMSVGDVAARFGVTELVVQQRLKLAKVAPALIAIYRKGGMSLKQLTAFAISDDLPAQERYWNKASIYERRPEQIRAALTKTEIDARRDPRAIFVGLDAFEAAGGHVRRDLFNGPGAGYLRDAKLLDRLALEKLEAAMAQVREEGWAWVEARGKCDQYSDLANFGRRNPDVRELTKAERADVAKHEKRIRELDEALNDEAVQPDEDDPRNAEIERLQADVEAIKEGCKSWSADAKKRAGAIVTINAENGRLLVHRGLLRNKASAPAAEAPRKSEATSKVEAKPAKATLSQALVQRLTAHRTMALRAELLARPDVALVAIVHKMSLEEFYRSSYRDSALSVTLHQETGVEQFDGTIKASIATQAVEGQRATWKERLPKSAKDLWAWLLAAEQGLLTQLLAFLVANRVIAVEHRDPAENNGARLDPADDLAAALDLDMRKWWEATVESYLGAVPKGKVLEALREAGVDKASDAYAAIEGAKSKEAAAAAAKLLKGKGWLPKLLRSRAAPKSAGDAAAIAKAAKTLARKAPPKGKTKAKRTAKPKSKKSRA